MEEVMILEHLVVQVEVVVMVDKVVVVTTQVVHLPMVQLYNRHNLVTQVLTDLEMMEERVLDKQVVVVLVEVALVVMVTQVDI